VSLLSGGVDSLAGAAMLLEAKRRPHLILHYSGNPTVRQAQDSVVTVLRKSWPASHLTSTVQAAPDTSREEALPYPQTENREDSRRARSLLFMVLGAVAAATAELEDVYLPENGVLTAALPLTRARIGSFSTRSTDPGVINQFNRLCEQAGWEPLHVSNQGRAYQRLPAAGAQPPGHPEDSLLLDGRTQAPPVRRLYSLPVAPPFYAGRRPAR